MSTRRRPTRYRYSKKKKKQEDSIPIKGLIFILVIAFSLAMRFASTGPLYKVREKITEVLSYSVDFEEAAETLGRAFTGENEDESAVLVFGRMILGLDDTEKQDTGEADTDDIPEQTPTSSLPEINSISNTMAGDISGLTFDIPESPMPVMDISSFDFGFSEEEYDGTPNQAFKIPSPDSVDDTKYTMDFKTVKPLSSYRITSRFGYRIHPISGNTTFHYGVDLAASAGTKIKSIADGTVAETGYGSINGNYVKISHKDGFMSLYAHMQSIGVKKGQSISAGDTIGKVGSTGYSTGPHLHFEVRKNGMIVSPFDYFDF